MYRLLLTSVGNPWAGAAGGGAVVTHEISRCLAQRGHEVTTLYIGTGWERKAHSPEYRSLWLPAPSHRPLAVALMSAVAFAILAKRLSFRVLHASGFEGALVGPRVRRSTKVVTTIHHPNLPYLAPVGLSGRWAPAAAGRLWRMRRYYLDQRAALHADAVVAVSRYSAAQLVENYHVPEDHVHVVHNGVNTSATSLAVCKRLPRQIVFAGRFDEGKGLDVLLRAIALGLGENVPPVKIIGAGVLGRALRALAGTLKIEQQVDFLGWLPHDRVIAELAKASVCVMPSRFESFGLVAAEAMAVGTPVVAAKAGALPETVLDGDTGVLVPPGDPEALAGALRRLLEDPRLAEKMGKAGHDRIRSFFTWSQAAERLEGLYASLLAGA